MRPTHGPDSAPPQDGSVDSVDSEFADFEIEMHVNRRDCTDLHSDVTCRKASVLQIAEGDALHGRFAANAKRSPR